MIRTEVKTVDTPTAIVVDYDPLYESGTVQLGLSYAENAVELWAFLDENALADLITVLQYYQAIGEGKIQE